MASTASKTDPDRSSADLSRTTDSFDRLYRDHVDLMYRFATRLCGESQAAKDLVQETFLNAYRGYKAFRGDDRSRPGSIRLLRAPACACGFGAVDWRTDVFVNDVKIGSHQGGYTPFTFNITAFLKRTGPQKLTVKVWDPTDKGFQPRGKQVLKPGGIFYTAVTGIWQTVWIEPVNLKHITAVRTA